MSISWEITQFSDTYKSHRGKSTHVVDFFHFVSIGVAGDDGIVYTVGYSNAYPGGLAERVLVGNGGHLKIPDGVNPYHAAVTEPLAAGYNSVIRADIAPARRGSACYGCRCGRLGSRHCIGKPGHLSHCRIGDIREKTGNGRQIWSPRGCESHERKPSWSISAVSI